MTHRITFEVPGKPQPKQRARRGKGERWYTPTATREFERLVAQYVVFTRRPRSIGWPMDARYRVDVTCHMPDNRKRDADNVAKSVLDGLNGVLWDDDSQVVELTTRKDLDRENPRTVVTVEVMK